MIKRKILAVVLTHCCMVGFSQSNSVDILRSKLVHTTNVLERFDLLNNILLDVTSYKGNNIDSVETMELIQIAQKLNNDSLKAISYNWLATYFYQKKGDNTSALEFYFKALPLAEKIGENRRISSLYFDMALVYFDMLDNEKALEVTRKGGEYLPDKSHPLYDFMLIQYEGNLTQYFLIRRQADSAFHYAQRFHETSVRLSRSVSWVFSDYTNFAAAYAGLGDEKKAHEYFTSALSLQDSVDNTVSQLYFYNSYIPFLLANNRTNDGLIQSRKLLALGLQYDNNNLKLAGVGYLRQLFDAINQIDSAYYYSRMEAIINSQIFSQENKNKVQALVFSEQLRSIEEKNRETAYRNQVKQYGLIAGMFMVLLIALILFRSIRQKQKANKVLEATLANLKSAQSQLIQSEKMASLGELTAGIAHEIQNPLNFVNNFSEVNKELADELEQEVDKGNSIEVKALAKDIKENQEKILHHGKRADAIVKGMLQHSRSSSGIKEPTDINVLADEYLRLAYHGLRAKDKSFNAKFETNFDESIGKIDVVPQDIGRVILNLITNAFYAVNERQKLLATSNELLATYEPNVSVSTKKEGNKVLISVKDNGNGIPDSIKEKIFQPFFTTKPTGQGTGLGLSLSYDIVKAHGGELKVETKEGVGSEFMIVLQL